jgi:DNA-binding beta-propeller fold protein YncE
VNILVTSAAGTNGDGYGSILAFTLDGKMLGAFGADSGITDPRGLRVHPDGDRVYVNNGDDRILSLDPHGRIAAKTGPIANLNPGGGNFGPDGRYYIGSRTARTIMAFPPGLLGSGKAILPSGVVPFPRGFALVSDGRLFLASGHQPIRRWGTGRSQPTTPDTDQRVRRKGASAPRTIALRRNRH